jgi:hypothetical protein
VRVISWENGRQDSLFEETELRWIRGVSDLLVAICVEAEVDESYSRNLDVFALQIKEEVKGDMKE